LLHRSLHRLLTVGAVSFQNFAWFHLSLYQVA
jgi:hypothetical protein